MVPDSNVPPEQEIQIDECELRELLQQREQQLREVQERLNLLVEMNTDGLLVVDRVGIVCFCNAGAESILGRPRLDLLGKEFDFPFLERGSSEISIARADGGTTIVEMLSVGVLWGEQPAFLISLRNITERRRNEEAIRRLAETQSSILNALPAHVALLDSEGKILAVNAAWRRYAEANNFRGFGLGLNYISVCEAGGREGLSDAVATAEGIRAVLLGKTDVFSLEYPAHSPLQKRWFRLMVTPVLHGRIEGAVVMHIDTTVRKLTDDIVERNEELYRTIVEGTDNGVWLVDASSRTNFVSRKMAEMLGTSREDLMNSDITDFIEEADLELLEDSLNPGRAPKPVHLDLRLRHPAGHNIWVTLNSTPLLDKDGRCRGAVRLVSDISDRKHLEALLLQAQKMEAVGRLAGGIAHDFNNLLTVILGYTSVLLKQLPPTSAARGKLEEVQKAGERAADLTSQLLAFSRKQILQPAVIDLNEVIGGLQRMLSPIIGEDIHLEVEPDPEPCMIKADSGQISQVILNLVINARDAMPNGGRLTIKTQNIAVRTISQQAHPGQHVLLRVQDTGTGMDPDTRSHIFEPFFTTKEPGQGTGLGLAMVYGIIEQSGGFITVDSEVGQGTTFDIYLPLAARQPPESDSFGAGDVEVAHTGTVLLVEDDPSVRELASEALMAAGYRVIAASDGNAALEAASACDQLIDVVVTDVVMPGMSGPDLVDRLRGAGLNPQVLYMSGFTDHPMIRRRQPDDSTAFVQKPFSPERLLAKIGQLLNVSSNTDSAAAVN